MLLPRGSLLVCVTAVVTLWMTGDRGSEAREVRIPAYRPRNATKPVVRIIPSDSVLIRLRKPESPKSVPVRGESSITRIQPVLLTPQSRPPRADLGDVLRRMRLRSMASLIRKARLQKFLQEAGPVTLFAPTDEAFSLTSPPEDPDRLRDFVLQHVVPGRITALDLRNDLMVASLRSGNRPLRFNVYEDGQMLSVSGSQFLDDARDAGSIRVQPVDRVLYPISGEDLVNEVRLTFPRMHRFLLNSSLTPQLTSGTFTLFAPTDAAFEALTPDVRQKLFHNATLMRKVLLNHVVPGTHYSAVLAHGYSLRSLGGEPIYFTSRRGLILANGMPVVKSDISVSNGVIHAVNRLLLPPELHARRRPATMAPPPAGREPATAPPRHDVYRPVPTYVEPPPAVPRSLTKTMTTPLRLPDGRTETFSTANSLFRRSLLMTTLRDNMTDHTFTILIPTDGAFDLLAPGTLDRMRRDTRLLRRMLLSQMIEGAPDLRDGESRPVRSLGGTVVLASLDGGKSYMAGGARVLSIRPATNGVVMVTDRVVFPPPPRSVADALAPLVALRRVVDKQPDIREALASEGSVYTVFAPTDVALSSLPTEQQQDPKFLSELFWSHVVPGAYYRSRLAPGLQLTTSRGHKITIRRTPEGGVRANDVPLTGEEILAGNGVVHKLDGLLFVPPFASAVPAEEEDELSQVGRRFNATLFLDWMKRAGMRNVLREQVSRSGGCTLFLPTDSSLAAMSPTLRFSTLGDDRRLRKFVRYHVSPRPLRWESVADNALLPTLLPGRPLRCNVYARGGRPGVLSVSGCRVSAMRPLGNNVTVAVIEGGTLSPPVGDALLTVSKSPFLSNFSKILRVAHAEQMLEDGGPYTLFAPDACVFAKMDSEEYRQIIANKKLAREFVRRYLVRGCYYSGGLYDGQTLVTEAGTELHVRVTPDCILVSGARLLHGDMSATDGVLHVVGDPLPASPV